MSLTVPPSSANQQQGPAPSPLGGASPSLSSNLNGVRPLPPSTSLQVVVDIDVVGLRRTLCSSTPMVVQTLRMKIQESPVACDAGRIGGGEVRTSEPDREDVPRLDLTALTEESSWGGEALTHTHTHTLRVSIIIILYLGRGSLPPFTFYSNVASPAELIIRKILLSSPAPLLPVCLRLVAFFLHLSWFKWLQLCLCFCVFAVCLAELNCKPPAAVFLSHNVYIGLPVFRIDSGLLRIAFRRTACINFTFKSFLHDLCWGNNWSWTTRKEFHRPHTSSFPFGVDFLVSLFAFCPVCLVFFVSSVLL